jgi:soluble lytic murein transglycosylase
VVSLPFSHLATVPLATCGGFSEFTFQRCLLTALLALCCLFSPPVRAADDPLVAERGAFTEAWRAAGQGDRDTFEKAMSGLQDYLLYPYLQYEDLRHRRTQVSAIEMSAFLEKHADWAFTAGLEKAWLRSLGRQGRWDALLQYGALSKDTEVRCYLAQARIRLGQADGLLPVAQQLWTAGKSQPDACDPVFAWLKTEGGITSGLAWERVRLAMAARERNLARYVARYLDQDGQVWADRWQKQDRGGYRQLQQAHQWPDTEKAWQISEYGLRRLARNDPDRAWEIFRILDEKLSWPSDNRGGILVELALWSAVNRSVLTTERMQAVPDEYRDDRLFEWWVRTGLAQADWAAVVETIGNMSPQARDDSRWRYWDARARLEAGQTEEAQARLASLALRANYYGFLAADLLGLDYTICPEQPRLSDGAVAAVEAQEGFDRALELRRVGLSNWARSEWKLAMRGFENAELRAVAALATRENWPDMAIVALGNSGDLRWYEWRFPLGYAPLVQANTGPKNLDPSWVMGLMRSESALAADAISHAGARGLMQITPHTATQLARRHSLAYSGRAQLFDAETNVLFGTTYLRDLMDRFGGNPVLVSAAYNAGPNAVDRWISDGYTGDPAVWIDTLPYFETRDYIPRVLAFSTIYEWRFGQGMKRISQRMLPIGPDPAGVRGVPRQDVDVVCALAAP